MRPRASAIVADSCSHSAILGNANVATCSAGHACANAACAAFDFDSAQAALAQACPAEQVATFALPRIALCEHESATIAEARGRIDEAGDGYLKALADWERLGEPYLPHRISTL